MKTFFRLSILLVMILAFVGNVSAQQTTDKTNLVDMMFTWDRNVSYSEISGTTFANVTDDGTWLRDIGFTFNYDNYNYTRCYINSNGILTFYPYTGSYSNYYSAYIYDNRPSVLLMRRDLYTRGSLSEALIGSAPNRIRIFQWKGIDFYYSYSANMNWQVWLYETSNKIEVRYGSMDRGSFGFGTYYYYWCHVGFSGRSASNWINVEVNNNQMIGHYSNKNPAPYNAEKYIRDVEDFSFFGPDLRMTIKPPVPEISGTIPANATVLELGQVHTGANHPGLFCEKRC